MSTGRRLASWLGRAAGAHGDAHGDEVSSQVEQGVLSHLRADAFGAHEAEGEVVLVVAAGAGAPDEHGGAR